MRTWAAVRPAGAAVAFLLLAACGEGTGSGLPSRTASITASVPTDRPTSTRELERTTEPTRDDEERATAEPTREPTRDEEERATVAPAPTTVARTVERTVTETAQAAPDTAAEPTPTAVVVTADPAAAEDGVPPWAWVLLLVALAGLGAVAVLIQRRNRRQDWEGAFDAAAAEVEWLTQQVIPDLARLTSERQRALTWGAASQRLDDARNELAGLAATAPDLEQAARAQVLTEALRRAQGRLEPLVVAGESTNPAEALQTIAQDLNTVLAQVRTTSPPAPTEYPRSA